MTTCKECGSDLGSPGISAMTYSSGSWSNRRQGNYCFAHQVSPEGRRAELIIAFAGWFILPFVYLLPFILLFLVLRFAR